MTIDMRSPAGSPKQEEELREAAVKRLRKKHDLQGHVLAFVTVNLLLNVVWLLTTPGGFYWPVFPLLGWGIGLAFNVWDVYAPAPTEEAIRREMERTRP